MTRSVRPCVSLPAELVALYRDHASRLPPLSHAAAQGLRLALLSLGDVDVPELAPLPARTAAATLAAATRRTQRRSR